MSTSYEPKNSSFSKKYELFIPSECPRCHVFIVPESLTDCTFKNRNGETVLSVIFYCPSCDKPFFTNYESFPYDDVRNQLHLTALCPSKPIKRAFSLGITSISPNFSRIYDEATIAESTGLTEIAGIGYRKALEFLMKEYLIAKHPDDEAFIRDKFLSTCIEKFITDPRLKPVATLCNRLGNDHTHFTRKYEEKDITDLKRLFDATVHWIEMDLLTTDASNEV